jgi:hypothetical protein
MLTKIYQTLRRHGIKTLIEYSWEEIKLLYKGAILSSYSQHEEDIEIEKLLNSKPKGFYVDIGTADPIRFSNTYRFYKK